MKQTNYEKIVSWITCKINQSANGVNGFTSTTETKFIP